MCVVTTLMNNQRSIFVCGYNTYDEQSENSFLCGYNTDEQTDTKKCLSGYVDYCVELLLFVLVLCKTTLPPTTETERTLIKSLNFEDRFQSLYARMPVLQVSSYEYTTISVYECVCIIICPCMCFCECQICIR